MASAEILDLPSGCNCDNQSSYTQDDIKAACLKALSLASNKKTEGRDKYPHTYNDYEDFKFPNAEKPYLEFPILSDGQVYDGSSPGADRVVIGSIAEGYGSAVFAAVITHDGSSKNGFTECQDDSVNASGKGSYEAIPEGRGKRREHGGERRLVKRIDYNDWR